jgi:peptide/nickel transport system permease protein
VRRLILRRLVHGVVALAIASVVIFASLFLAPGSPVTALTAGRPVNAHTRVQLERRYDLDKPFVVQYADWLGRAVTGDFGTSYVESESVSAVMAPRIGTTLILVSMCSLLILLAGMLSGAVAALKRGFLGTSMVVAEAIGLGVPTFVASLLLIAVFSVQLGWFPVFGSGSGFVDQLWHLTLPAIALALSSIAYIGRLTQASVEGELQKEHVTTATARGLPRGRVIRRHVLRNASIPVATASGIVVAYLVVGAAVVETAFSLNGLGALLVSAISQDDFPVIQAVSLIAVAAFLVIGFLVDVICARLDPRITLE